MPGLDRMQRFIFCIACLTSNAFLPQSTGFTQEGSESSRRIQQLKTIAEKSEYTATANEQDVLGFLQLLDQWSPYASEVTVGETGEGRKIQALVIAKEPNVVLPLKPDDPRLMIVLLGGIHSGECDGKEALLALARDLLSESKPKFIEDAILVFIPNFNADGNERVGKLHRPGQDGPSNGMGTRENAAGHDLNRDFIKIDTPEVRSLVRLIDHWDVDILIDAHTTNGSLHQYDLTYDIPHNPIANREVDLFLREKMLPKITQDMGSLGFPAFYYGNFSKDHKRWDSSIHEPRYSTEYMGLRGKIGILVESYSYASYQRRIDASYVFIEACLKELVSNRASVQRMLSTKPADSAIPVQAKVVAASGPVIAKGFEWLPTAKLESETDAKSKADSSPEKAVPIASEPNKYPTPRDRFRKSEMKPTDFEVQLLNVGEATATVALPKAYFIPKDNAWAASRLHLHGVAMQWIKSTTNKESVAATQYRISASKDLPEFQNHRLKKVEVQSESTSLDAKAGWIVPTNQPLGVLAAYMLEPHADDSLAVWNFFDPDLKEGSLYPVLRVEGPIPSTWDVQSIEPSKLATDKNTTFDWKKESLSLTKIYEPKQKISFSSMPSALPRWVPGKNEYLTQQDSRWFAVDCETGAMRPFDLLSKLVAALGKLDAFQNGQAANYAKRISVFDSKLENAIIEQKNDYFLYQSKTDKVRKLTHNAEQPKELAELSPTGMHLAYIHKNNLWVVNCESTEVKPLTNDGADEILNGKLDWVYQEEIYGRGQFKGYWWSPDGKQIAYLRLDETKVPRFQIDNSISFAQSLEETRYPKSGQPNPLVTLHVVDVTSGERSEIPLDQYEPLDRLVVRVAWNPDLSRKQVVFQMQNRIQSWLDVCTYDLESKKTKQWFRETSPAWVDVIEEPRWLPSGDILWLSDVENGRRHVFRVDSAGNRSAVTTGNWDVKSIDWVAEDGAMLIVSAHRSSPVNTDTLRIDIKSGAVEQLGQPTGSHRVSVHPSGAFYFDSWSDLRHPASLWLCNRSGTKIRNLTGYRSDRFETLDAGEIEMLEIKARDGFVMQGLLYKPSDFGKRSEKKMPVLIHVYGGPAARTVDNTWTHRSDLWHRFLAQQGICVLLCDNRSALGKGNSDTWKIYKDLGSVELKDLEDAVGWLAEQPWVDKDRIGLWGWSYGGYFTSFAMTHCKLFRAGVAGAPVTDWRNYDSVYTERYMSTPEANEAGYKSSSVVEAAGNLHGRLMLIHGEIDDNVHIANTFQLANALQNAGKQFDLMVYPGNRHGVVDPEQSYHMYQMMTNFFVEHLLNRSTE